jgi:hypothetical protein
MYRIELSPGEETAFRSIEELAVAIRRNVVTSRARIYHNATNKWLPIQFHPHYKIAVSMPLTQADLVAGPPVTPLSALKLGEAQSVPPELSSSSREAATQAALAAWPAPKPISAPAAKQSLPPAKQVSPPARRVPPPAPIEPREPLTSQPPITLGTPAPEPRRTVQPPRVAQPPRIVQPARIAEPPRVEPSRVVEPARSAPVRAKGSRKGRKPGRSLRIALAGAVLAACAHLLVSVASSQRSEIATLIRTPRRLIEVPIEAMKEDSPRTVAGVLPALQTIPLPRKASSPKRAPKPTPAARPPTTAKPQPRPDVPAPTIDSATIEPAPAAGDLSASVPVAPASTTSKMVDSSGKKALNRILNTIGGTPAPESKTQKR